MFYIYIPTLRELHNTAETILYSCTHIIKYYLLCTLYITLTLSSFFTGSNTTINNENNY